MIDKWVQDFREIAGNESFITIVGNKCDLGEGRLVIHEEGEAKAKKSGNPDYIETNAFIK
jgi:GTPase SAR1 family protein